MVGRKHVRILIASLVVTAAGIFAIVLSGRPGLPSFVKVGAAVCLNSDRTCNGVVREISGGWVRMTAGEYRQNWAEDVLILEDHDTWVKATMVSSASPLKVKVIGDKERIK